MVRYTIQAAETTSLHNVIRDISDHYLLTYLLTYSMEQGPS